MKTDNQIVKGMNFGKDILLVVIFSMIIWSNKSNIAEMVISKTDNAFLALIFIIGIGAAILLIFLIVRVVTHKLVFKIFGNEDN